MAQDDVYNKDFTDKADVSSGSDIQEKEDWLNEHGQPDFEYLKSLATDGSPEALEKLRSIAEDLDVGYDSNTLPKDLIERIGSAVAEDEDAGTRAIT